MNEDVEEEMGYGSNFFILMSPVREKGRASVHECKLSPATSFCW